MYPDSIFILALSPHVFSLTMSRSYQTQVQSHAQEAGPSTRPLDLLTRNFAQFDYEEPPERSTSVFQSFMANRDVLLSSTPFASHHNCNAPLGGSPINIDDVTLEGDNMHSNPPSHPLHSQGPTITPASSPAGSPAGPPAGPPGGPPGGSPDGTPDDDGNDDDYQDNPMD